ncbi:MAG: hypothetical protein EOS70_11935 [Mesorhizobium sp.]|uniref:hypothetical protein n=1 Tax=Mesorhizobium sp. TaxID=1871066 RepID=UPI000FE9FC56|nr:hypothetical protein [Mesorhizobium sp.]RWC34743.1 MAG: hypothetical protein EOS70_11935 [Mesorhizobium sp.]RWE69208.1 MAG: hypothetical protein EOS62_06850 [Mesorhizobium sp.]RWF02061.1 MAG: hypothetical protein EOS43_09070 [Mesorhizobium sp.]
MTTTTEDIYRPLALTARLLIQCWPQLLLVGCLGVIARDLLLQGAVTIGLQFPLGGMVMLSLVILAKLTVLVMMFVVLRPHMPAVAALRQKAKKGADEKKREPILAITAAAILPFFAYYAAWGFLGDTVREYSRMALAQAELGKSVNIFAILQSSGVVLSIVICWLVRFAAKRLNARASHPYWRLLIVATDATWVFIGLYALGEWKDQFIRWLGAGAALQQLSLDLLAPVTSAAAAGQFVPVEFRPLPFGEQLQNLFFFALLPIVWLVMAAIINGYELSAPAAPAPAPSRTMSWQKWLKDFATHFVGGYRSRYSPVWTCLKLTLSAGLATLVTFVIVYQAISWIGAWMWYGLTRLIGAHDLATWQIFADTISLFTGSPSELDGGILLDAVRVALLAAVLETAVAMAREARGVRSAAR